MEGSGKRGGGRSWRKGGVDDLTSETAFDCDHQNVIPDDVMFMVKFSLPQEGLPPLQTMDEMQCMWFQTEMALAFRRIGKLGHALQKLHEIDKVSWVY